ncbi:MAG: MerR family transcriptional regulator [Hydrogenimonas sp.]|nr:MerR family transcriptional regulator [Hydrogenimonas sp.]
MPLKMSELVKRSKTPKSTILYYIKEGLLPQPKKIKHNVHLYDEEFVDRIEFIKYLQNNFNASISQIKELIERGDFNFKKGFESILGALDILTAPSSEQRYTTKEAAKEVGVDEKMVKRLITIGVLFLRDGSLSEKELEILRAVKELESCGEIGRELIESYLKSAKELAIKEVESAFELLSSCDDKNRVVKSLFDATLILKPYIFNMHLIESFKSRKDNLK